MSELNTPLTVGDLQLKNRLVMAPLTRARSHAERVPTDLMVEYYKQRANAGLILTEATVISPKAVGYANTPGLWNQNQVEGWKKIIQAVHEQDAKIVAQLWHVGRVSDPELLDGDLPVAPSAIAPQGHVKILRPQRAYTVPHALTIDEIKTIIQQYKISAQLAKDAGFDGVELHAANGYLIDEFLQTNSNVREDNYGGSVENRARLLLEVVDEFIAIWGAGRVGVHISPRGDAESMGDENPLETFGYVMEQLSQRNIAFVFSREYEAEDSISPQLRQKFNGAWIANERLTTDSARAYLAEEKADAVAFGQAFIANPDLLHRLENNLAWNQPDPSTFYALTDDLEKGYTDYPIAPSV